MQTTHSHLAIVALQMVPLLLFAQDAADRPNILFPDFVIAYPKTLH